MTMKFYEDPTINGAATNLILEAVQRIDWHISNGDPWYKARERALDDLQGHWTTRYGKLTADRAAKAVYMIPPDSLSSRETKAHLKTKEVEYFLAYVKRKGKDNWLQRAVIRLTGWPLYALAVAVGGVLAVPGTPAAQERQRALAACVRAETDTERLLRQCWRFDTVEREVYRDWEHPADHGGAEPDPSARERRKRR